MTALERAACALARFGVGTEEINLIRHNENLIFSVKDNGARYILRIHECAEGFVSIPFTSASQNVQRMAETELLNVLGARGLNVQKPVRGMDGAFVQHEEDGTPVTLLSYLEGETYDALWKDGAVSDDAAFAAGLTAGRLNLTSRTLTARFAPARPRYGVNVLPLISQRLREARELSRDGLDSMLAALTAAKRRIIEAEAMDGLTVCHADISAGNIVYANSRASLIDFSLAGVASPYMDVASLLANFTREEVRRPLMAGYTEGFGQKPVISRAEPYFALQILLFIAMRHKKAAEWDWFAPACERWRRDVFTPLSEGRAFLEDCF